MFVGQTLTMAADKIIAVGQRARLDAFAELEPQRNTIETQHYQTRDPQVFAAGDIVGDKTVVYAVKTGKEAAGAIHHYLEALLMLTKIFRLLCGVKFPNPFCLSSSPVGNCCEMCPKPTTQVGAAWCLKRCFIANEVAAF